MSRNRRKKRDDKANSAAQAEKELAELVWREKQRAEYVKGANMLLDHYFRKAVAALNGEGDDEAACSLTLLARQRKREADSRYAESLALWPEDIEKPCTAGER